MFIRYNDIDLKFLEDNAHVIRNKVGEDNWYFFPYLFREIGNGIFQEVSFMEAPQHVKDFVQKIETSEPNIEITAKGL